MSKVAEYRKQLKMLLDPPEHLADVAEEESEEGAVTVGIEDSAKTQQKNVATETAEELAHIWDTFLLENSGLPGPRANLELANAVADEGEEDLFKRYAELGPEEAPVDSPAGFLAFCGVVGLGRLLGEGDMSVLDVVRVAASDPRWRMREAVAMALQRWGAKDFVGLMAEMSRWKSGNTFERRAAAAALCEPAQLKDGWRARAVLKILDDITASIEDESDRSDEGFKALRKGLGYCWSVAVSAHPDEGKPRMEKWLEKDDKDLRWIMKENLGKKRLVRMDKEWVATLQARLAEDPA
jgi:hypothetical protein